MHSGPCSCSAWYSWRQAESSASARDGHPAFHDCSPGAAPFLPPSCTSGMAGSTGQMDGKGRMEPTTHLLSRGRGTPWGGGLGWPYPNTTEHPLGCRSLQQAPSGLSWTSGNCLATIIPWVSASSVGALQGSWICTAASFHMLWLDRWKNVFISPAKPSTP